MGCWSAVLVAMVGRRWEEWQLGAGAAKAQALAEILSQAHCGVSGKAPHLSRPLCPRLCQEAGQGQGRGLPPGPAAVPFSSSYLLQLLTHLIRFRNQGHQSDVVLEHSQDTGVRFPVATVPSPWTRQNGSGRQLLVRDTFRP